MSDGGLCHVGFSRGASRRVLLVLFLPFFFFAISLFLLFLTLTHAPPSYFMSGSQSCLADVWPATWGWEM